jgi:hypothetical protein
MKKILIISSLFLLVSNAFGAGGTFILDNKVADFQKGIVVDQPIFDVDGTTGLPSSFTIGVYSGTSESSLSLLATTTTQTSPTVTPGYFAGLSLDDPSVTPGGNAIVQVRAWNGSDFESATVRGVSSFFSVTTGGVGMPASLPTTVAPGNDPIYMTGFQSFSVMNVVPEPSTVALGVIGGLGMLLRRRKN